MRWLTAATLRTLRSAKNKRKPGELREKFPLPTLCLRGDEPINDFAVDPSLRATRYLGNRI